MVPDSDVNNNSIDNNGVNNLIPSNNNSSTISSNGVGGGNGSGNGSGLCASCDRCRARKTKCDGKRPCSNCLEKYLKKYKLSSYEGVPVEKFDCIYSPAKRRGPIPGRTSTTRRSNDTNVSAKSDDSTDDGMSASQEDVVMINPKRSNAPWLQPNGMESTTGTENGAVNGLLESHLAALLGSQKRPNVHLNQNGTDVSNDIQQQIKRLQQQLQLQQQQQQLCEESVTSSLQDERNAQRIKVDESAQNTLRNSGVPRTIVAHTHLLDRSDEEGSRLRAYYRLSIDELFCLPATPTDEEYCARLNIVGLTPSMIPGTHLAALSAARFAEAALGAIVHNEVSLALELCNAVVHCLRESVQEPVQTPVIYEVAKAYFLLGVFRAFRGDMQRYFKYRRVCLNYLSKLGTNTDTQILLASISYLDSWAYMIYNANESSVPESSDRFPMPKVQGVNTEATNECERKYNIRTDLQAITCDPKNKNWIQGAPSVYLNNEAPLRARVLDALACAIRTCCDQANSRFTAIANEINQPEDATCRIPPNTCLTHTTIAVLAHENELCSRNLVLSAFALMQQNDGKGYAKTVGQHMIISAMDAFLENSNDGGSGGFSDSQIQSLLSVCNTALECPLLLYHAGPTYHMVSNAATLLCHFLNGMNAMKASSHFGTMEETVFDEVVDTFMAIRKLLTIHRRKLPVKLRCHGIPRPNLNAKPGEPFVDLGETLLCICRGCQGFVLMACSPCVAAERARSAASRIEVAAAQEAEALEMGEIDGEFPDMGADFSLDDDALLGLISNLLAS